MVTLPGAGVFYKKTQSTFEKSRKMTGVTLRYKWIT